MACPFFFPTEKFDDKVWHHRPRLPLGDGYLGVCMVDSRKEFIPHAQTLREFCNLGYALACPRFPSQHATHAVRFAVVGDRDDVVTIYYVLEKDHQPGEHGELAYGVPQSEFLTRHQDPIVQRQAEVYLESYLRRKARPDGPLN
jgi:hypothetical protein